MYIRRLSQQAGQAGKATSLGSLGGNLQKLRESVDRALKRSGREGDSVEIIAVTKTVEISKMEEAVDLGVSVFGENRVQEAKRKALYFQDENVSWHMIGHLQRNKVKAAVSLFTMIHSLHSMSLAEEISRRAVEQGAVSDLLLQVNTTADKSRYGVLPSEVESFLEWADRLTGIRIRGLMTMAPFTDDTARIRKSFRTLRQLFKQAEGMQLINSEMRFLSMGMTADFEIAIEEGSNMIRVGTALFGARGRGDSNIENYTA